MAAATQQPPVTVARNRFECFLDEAAILSKFVGPGDSELTPFEYGGGSRDHESGKAREEDIHSNFFSLNGNLTTPYNTWIHFGHLLYDCACSTGDPTVT